jgi:tetratricopeptide (TPR) repeat protein
VTLLPLMFPLAACGDREAPDAAAARAPLYTNLGSHHHAISTESAGYFDQGLALSYAFNHAEAIRAFRQAATLDPDCAMCYWGVAFALGPNINAPITEEAAKESYQEIGRARDLARGASEKERAYIEALAKRYVADPKADRPPLDSAYAASMRDLARRFPDDLDAQTLFAQSLMDTSPWNYWDRNGTPRAFTNEVLGTLESVIARNPNHAGAIHLYIHAVEASPDPGRAEQHADRLASLMPGAGHIVHMPAHIYVRTGRYGDATKANQAAIKADDEYLAGDAVAGNMTYQIGYYPHNIHFMVASASFEGRKADALKAAEEVKAKLHADMFSDPGMGGMVQHFALTPLFTKVRFAVWDEVLAEPPPPDGLTYMQAIWHGARGLAHAARNQIAEAEKEREAMAAIKDSPALETLGISSVNVASDIVAIAHELLEGELAVKQRRAGAAADHFAKAVAIEDALTYMEPPDWPIPVRQLKGDAMLALGRPVEAEGAFREDLRQWPDNGWSLAGLQASLARQGKTRDAAAAEARFEEVWKGADRDVRDARLQASTVARASVR